MTTAQMRAGTRMMSRNKEARDRQEKMRKNIAKMPETWRNSQTDLSDKVIK